MGATLDNRRQLMAYMVIDGATDAVEEAAGCSMVVTTPTEAWTITPDADMGSLADPSVVEIVAKVQDTIAAPRHTVVDTSTVAGSVRIGSVDLAGAGAAAAQKVTVFLYRVLHD